MEEKALTLDELRVQIDSIDSQIVELFEKRMIVSEGIAKAKLATNHPIFDEAREAIKIQSVKSKVTDKSNEAGVEALFMLLMDESKKRQKAVVSKVKGEV